MKFRKYEIAASIKRIESRGYDSLCTEIHHETSYFVSGPKIRKSKEFNSLSDAKEWIFLKYTNEGKKLVTKLKNIRTERKILEKQDFILKTKICKLHKLIMKRTK